MKDPQPQYKIHGMPRRFLKKELGLLKSYVKNFWHFHALDRDMMGDPEDDEGYPDSIESACKKLEDAKCKIRDMESLLAVPFYRWGE